MPRKNSNARQETVPTKPRKKSRGKKSGQPQNSHDKTPRGHHHNRTRLIELEVRRNGSPVSMEWSDPLISLLVLQAVSEQGLSSELHAKGRVVLLAHWERQLAHDHTRRISLREGDVIIRHR